MSSDNSGIGKKNYNRNIWAAFIAAILLASFSSWNVSSLYTNEQNNQEVSELKGQIDNMDKQMDGIRSNRDNYRENSLNCSLAYRDLKNVLLVGRLDQDDLDEVKIRIKTYDQSCKLVTETGVGG